MYSRNTAIWRVCGCEGLSRRRVSMADSLAGDCARCGWRHSTSPLARGCVPRRSVRWAAIALVDLRSTRLGAVGSGRPRSNVHHRRGQLEDHLAGRVHVSVEDLLLGTAGALGRLRGWLDGRDAVVVNADAGHRRCVRFGSGVVGS